MNGRETASAAGTATAAAASAASAPDLLKKPAQPAKDERPPFDADAT